MAKSLRLHGNLFNTGPERDIMEREKINPQNPEKKVVVKKVGGGYCDNPGAEQPPQDMELTTEELKRTKIHMRFSNHREGGGIHYIQSFESLEKLVEDATEPGEGRGKVAILSMRLQPQAAWVFNQYILPELEQDSEQIIIEIIKEDDGSARM